uniref:Uncharacterized protein n=1 Tax=Solanum tuberosum TaxID=4113 RepID=M0ZPW2_SOLTU
MRPNQFLSLQAPIAKHISNWRECSSEFRIPMIKWGENTKLEQSYYTTTKSIDIFQHKQTTNFHHACENGTFCQ